MDASIIVALIAGAISIAGMVGNYVKDRKTRRERKEDDDRTARANQPDKAMERMVAALSESEKQAERTAHRLEECENGNGISELRVMWREAVDSIDQLQHQNRQLHRDLNDARLECEHLKESNDQQHP